jgi:hypothetical protein
MFMSVIGAWIFYMIEHDHEVWLHKREQEQLGKLRNETFFRLKRVFGQGIRRTIRQQAFDPQQAASGSVLVFFCLEECLKNCVKKSVRRLILGRF